MRIKKIALGSAAASVVGLAAMFGTGTAFAATTPAPVPPAQTATVQQGNQTTPDTGTSTEKAGVEAPESSSSATETTGTASDGPGGHQDPAGNVDHQFDGQE